MFSEFHSCDPERPRFVLDIPLSRCWSVGFLCSFNFGKQVHFDAKECPPIEVGCFVTVLVSLIWRCFQSSGLRSSLLGSMENGLRLDRMKKLFNPDEETI